VAWHTRSSTARLHLLHNSVSRERKMDAPERDRKISWGLLRTDACRAQTITQMFSSGLLSTSWRGASGARFRRRDGRRDPHKTTTRRTALGEGGTLRRRVYLAPLSHAHRAKAFAPPPPHPWPWKGYTLMFSSMQPRFGALFIREANPRGCLAPNVVTVLAIDH